MKKLDALWDGKVRAGFEMLVNMFSAGIVAFAMALTGFWVVAPIVNKIMDGPGQRRGDAGRQQPAAAHLGGHRAGQGVLPQQRHQPRRAHPARADRGRRDRQVRALPARGQPRPGSRPAHRDLGLRQGRGQGHGPRCGDHPVLRRHPRDLLPVRPDEAQADPGHDRRRHDRRGHQRRLRRGPARPGRARLDLRRLRPDRRRLLHRRDPRGVRLRRGDLRGGRRCCSRPTEPSDEGDLAAATAQMEANKGKKSSVAGALDRAPARPRASRCTASCSPATPAWAPPRWGPRCCARRSRPPATATSRSSTRRSPTSTTATTWSSATRTSPTGRKQRTPVGDARLGGQLHGLAALRRDRRADRPDQRPGRGGGRGAGRGHAGATCSTTRRSCCGAAATSRDDAITEAGPAARRERRRRGVVRRRDARAGDVGLDPHGQPAGHPARHQRGQVVDQPDRRSRSSATPTASTGTASRSSS